jgi:ribonuclease P protein component
MVSDVAASGSGGAPGRGKGEKFPRSLHLLRHADFERVYKQGRRHFAAHLTVFYLRRAGGGPRIGFTVPQALGGAVERNRMRRRLREAVRQSEPRTLAAVDVVMNPKKSLLRADFGELEKEIGRAFEVIKKGGAKSE